MRAGGRRRTERFPPSHTCRRSRRAPVPVDWSDWPRGTKDRGRGVSSRRPENRYRPTAKAAVAGRVRRSADTHHSPPSAERPSRSYTRRWNHTPKEVHDEAPSSPAPSLLRRRSPGHDHVPLRPQDTPHRCNASWAVIPGMRPSPPSEPASAARPQAEVRCKPMFGRVVMLGLLPRVPSVPQTRWPSRLGRYTPPAGYLRLPAQLAASRSVLRARANPHRCY